MSLLINELGYNKNSFSHRIGMSNNTTIGNLVNKEKYKPSYDVLIKIARTFPEVNIDWLVTGRGQMIPETSVLSINIQKRIQKTIKKLNGRMSLTEIAEMLTMKKSDLEIAFDAKTPSIDLIVKLIQNQIINSGELLFGRALSEHQSGDCDECDNKDMEIIKLQRELIECLKNEK